MAAAVLLLVAACSSEPPRGAPEPSSRVNQLAREAVSVEGRVEAVIDAHVFLIGAAQPVLVVHDGPAPPAQGDIVSVTGRVDRFDPRRLGGELGVAFDLALVTAYTGQRCLVATKVRFLDAGPGPPSGSAAVG